ncbi:hypothetical protein D3C86_1567870 [compost metagenome]
MEADFLIRLRLGKAGDEQIGDRRDIKRHQRRETETADNDPAERDARFRARALRQHQRHATKNGGDHRHHDRAQADAGGLFDGFPYGRALIAQMIGEFHDQDAVLGHHANKQHKTDLTIDVEA